MSETSRTERKKLEWELKQARDLIRRIIAETNLWYGSNLTEDSDIEVARLRSELIGFMIDSCPNIKRVGKEAWSEQYANMGDFITVISYGSEMMDGELGYDFNNDERVVIRK